MTELQKARIILEDAERQVRFVAAYVRGLEKDAGPGIVTFETSVCREQGAFIIADDRLRPFVESHISVHVSERPFYTHPGECVASGVYWKPHEGQDRLVEIDGEVFYQWLTGHAKPGDDIVILRTE